MYSLFSCKVCNKNTIVSSKIVFKTTPNNIFDGQFICDLHISCIDYHRKELQHIS